MHIEMSAEMNNPLAVINELKKGKHLESGKKFGKGNAELGEADVSNILSGQDVRTIIWFWVNKRQYYKKT